MLVCVLALQHVCWQYNMCVLAVQQVCVDRGADRGVALWQKGLGCDRSIYRMQVCHTCVCLCVCSAIMRSWLYCNTGQNADHFGGCRSTKWDNTVLCMMVQAIPVLQHMITAVLCDTAVFGTGWLSASVLSFMCAYVCAVWWL